MEKKNEEVRQEKMELQTIEERLQSLIESYAFEIEEETKNLKKYVSTHLITPKKFQAL